MEIEVSDHLKNTMLAAAERFQAEISYYRQQVTLIVNPDRLLELIPVLRNEFNFPMLMDITAVDYLSKEPRFHVVYQLKSLTQTDRLTVRVPLNGNHPKINSIVKFFPGANWCEREVFDMFGIEFIGHPYLKRILMPANWEGYPLRKDYPLGYEEVEFSFSLNDIESRKPKGHEFLSEDEY